MAVDRIKIYLGLNVTNDSRGASRKIIKLVRAFSKV